MNIKTEARKRLMQFGIKPSLHRLAVMEYLMGNLTHPTTDTIYNNLFPAIPTLSKTTVYNILKLFEEKRAIAAIVIDGKNARYDSDISQHAHFQCRKCGSVRDLRLKETLPVMVENSDNLVIDDCHIYFRGYCSECGKNYISMN
ncbi:MAG: transcriptional repressor [Dysgonamonadaceae bacterium]|jgi:Fur family ferric uptake transcriptional regulator/Fur family peroxide stress response transcriptional regulator|nr:transcriptional repressor [Dysgonamonadaceae bacterium]